MKTISDLVKVILLIIIVLPVSSCQKSELGKEIDIHVGERQKINSNLSFKVDSLWDSRCPLKWECGLAGNVDLFFSINLTHNQIDTLLAFYPGSNMVPFDVAGYKWKVLEVNPYPDSTYTKDLKDVLISLIITKD